MSEALAQKLAPIIAEHVEIAYQLDADGRVDPNTIRVSGALGAAYMALHFIKQHMTGDFVVEAENA